MKSPKPSIPAPIPLPSVHPLLLLFRALQRLLQFTSFFVGKSQSGSKALICFLQRPIIPGQRPILIPTSLILCLDFRQGLLTRKAWPKTFVCRGFDEGLLIQPHAPLCQSGIAHSAEQWSLLNRLRHRRIRSIVPIRRALTLHTLEPSHLLL